MNRNLFATLITLCCFFVTHAQINIALDATAPSCDGFTDGRITATIEGGTAPYTYAWNTGANSSTIFSAPTGTYSLTVTDTDGTTATETIDLIAPAPLGIELSAGTSVCDGAATNYTVQATGGTAPYRYTWSNGQMGNTLNPAEEEVYYVTVEDANGCSNTFPVKIFQPLTVEVVTIGTRCPNFCDASAEAVIAGGFAPYTFSWNTGDTIQILETLPAGTYTVTVTDANGCVVVGTGVAEAASDIEFAVEVNGTCGSSSITANVNAEGGNGGIQIAWSTGNTGMMVEGLTPGETYSVTVTDVAGCTKREEFTVPNETGLVIDLEAQNLACGATTGGTATVTPLGGTAPYSIIWGNGELAVNTIEDLSVGEYCVTVIDANGCRGEQCVEITASQGLNLEVDSTPAICGTMPPDGMANVVPSGGTAPYVYAWNDGQSTGTAVGLSAGDYRVTVTDAAGCEGLANVTVEEVVDIEINATLDATSATLEVEGGTGPYTITWSNGQTGITAMDLVAGECYQVTITDANACTTQEEVCLPSTNVDFTFALTPDCNQTGGAATINIVGGIAPYNIEWVGVQNGGTSVDGLSPGNYTVVVTDSNGTQRTRFFDITSANLEVVANASAVECGVANSGSANVEVQNPTAGVEYTYRWSDDNTTANRTGLMPGIYMVTVTSSEGCTNVQELIIESEALTLQLENITNIDCEGNLGTATVSVPNAENITYTWNDNATGATRNDLQAGTYTVMATDAAGCEATQTLTIEVATNVAASFELEESMDCETGMITLVATNTTEGNVANLEWQYGEETVQGQENITIELNPNLNPILDIRLNASSADGCLATTTQTFSAMEFVLNVEITNSVEVCENEIVELEVVNNNADMTLTYEWSPASAFEAGTINQAKPNFIADSSTDVTVTVMNSMGCSIAQTIPVTIAAITAPDLSAFNYEESCLGNIVRFSSTEDLSNYTWNFGDPNNPTTETGASEYEFTYSDAGEYTLTLTPNENALCQEAVSTNIVVEGARDLAFTLDGATEFCGSSNPITVTEDFETINWYAVEDTENPLATGAEYTPEPGTYLVEVVNEEGCVGQQEITVTDNSPSYTLLGNQNICVGDELQLNLETENVTTVTWSPNDPLLIDDANSLNPIFTLDETTIFTLTVTNGTCLQTEQITIEVNDLPEATATADLTEIFIGQESNLDILGNGEYTVTWNNTSTLSRDDVPNPVASPEETTVYGVTIEDENGCFINDEVEITVLVDPCDQPHIFVPNAFTPNRDGVNDVLYVRGLHIDELDFVVHNRWGQQVFHTTDKNIGWDGFHNGDLATGDAFGWYLEVTCFDGTTTVLKGNVTLIR